MSSHLHLGLDLDGTLADHTGAKLEITESLGYAFTPRETASEVLQHLMTPEHYRELQHRLYRKLADGSPRNDGVLQTLEELRKRGWHFSLVSRRKGDGRAGAGTWIARELSELIPSDRLFFVDQDSEKDDVCAREGVVAFVDDQQGVLQYLQSVPCRILFDPFGNYEQQVFDGIVAMKSWKELPALLSPLEAER